MLSQDFQVACSGRGKVSNVFYLFIYFFHIKICPQVTGLRNCLLSPETVETEIKHVSFGLKDADSFTFGKLPIYESWGCSTSLCLSEVFKHYSNFFFLIHAV